MTTYVRRRSRGQVLMMVTFALIMMCGMLGLVVDLGWAYFTKKSAQAAADAAALAAVRKAMDSGGYSCNGTTVMCQADPVSCKSSPGGNLSAACYYAAQNGFDTSNPRQDVLVQAADRTLTPPTVVGCAPTVYHPPTTGCVDTYYWVTVRVVETIPQLFSAVLGNTQMTVAARATAAASEVELIGSLILLNREGDPATIMPSGTDMQVSGGPDVKVPGGIEISSSQAPSNSTGGGMISGTGSGKSGYVDTPWTLFRTGGGVGGNHPENWLGSKSYSELSDRFADPMSLKGGQPPLYANQASAPSIQVPEDSSGKAFLTTSQCPDWVCPAGNYYACNMSGGSCVATGSQILVPKNVSTVCFGTCSTSGVWPSADYVFFGGLQMGAFSPGGGGGGGSSPMTVNLGPGRYVFAGIKAPTSGNQWPSVLDVSNNVNLIGGAGGDAGRALILTNSSYGGTLDAVVSNIPGATQTSTNPWLKYSSANLQSGNNGNSVVNLYGLNRQDTDLPTNLYNFVPVVIWQDQGNSTVTYNSVGAIAFDGATLDSPHTQTPNSPKAPQLTIQATPSTIYSGVIYQPRGAWTVFQGSGVYQGPIQIITGAMQINGGDELTLTSPTDPVKIITTALIE